MGVEGGQGEEGGGYTKGAEGIMLLKPSTTERPVSWPLQEDTVHSSSHAPPRSLVLAKEVFKTNALVLESCRGLGTS